MNKKVIKYVLMVCGIVLLFGLGIWGYKYIKNRNDDKKVNENENELKEVESLTSYGSSSVGSYTLNYYYNGPIDMGQTCVFGGSSTLSCIKRNYYLTIYINDSIKLKASWVFYSYESNSSKVVDGYMKKNVTANVLNSKFLIISLSNFTFCDSYSGEVNMPCDGITYDLSKTGYPYTKVFDATTGDMIYAIPTNSNESISFSTVVYDGSTAISGSAFSKNMYVNGNLNAVYYLKSNYTLSDGNNTEVHKVVFGDSYTNKYQDTIIGYAKGTITLNS